MCKLRSDEINMNVIEHGPQMEHSFHSEDWPFMTGILLQTGIVEHLVENDFILAKICLAELLLLFITRNNDQNWW